MNKQLDHKQLIDIIQRIERLDADAKQVAEDIKTIYDEAKSLGYEPKYIKQCIKLRAKDPDELAEEDELLELYRTTLGI